MLKNPLFYFSVLIFFIIFSYLSNFIFSNEIVRIIGGEDGVIEYLSFISFFIASIFFFLTFRRNRFAFVFFLSLIMFIASGEELSWGQRIIGFDSPEYMQENNVQNEVNFHNLELFNVHNFDGTKKNGLARLFEIEFLFKLFCLVYFSVLPLLIIVFPKLSRLFTKLNIPIPPLFFIYVFPINWIIMRLIVSVDNQDSIFSHYLLDWTYETMEFNAALMFMFLSLFFYNNLNLPDPLKKRN